MTAIRISSSDPLSTFHTQAGLLADVLKDAGAIDAAEVLTSTGSVMNAVRVAKGEAELGFMASNWVPRAVKGEAPFGLPTPVAIVTPLNAGPLFFVARADSPLRAVRDLKGKPIAVGHVDSGMAQHARNIAAGLGWAGDDTRFDHTSTFDGGAALRDGRVAAQLSAPIPSAHFSELCAAVPIKVLDFDAADIDALCAVHPFYSPTVVPADCVPGMTADAPALGVLNVIVAAANAPDDFVAAVVRAFVVGAPRLEKANPLFRGLPALLARARKLGKAALAPADAPLHPAAARAFRDAGLLT